MSAFGSSPHDDRVLAVVLVVVGPGFCVKCVAHATLRQMQKLLQSLYHGLKVSHVMSDPNFTATEVRSGPRHVQACPTRVSNLPDITRAPRSVVMSLQRSPFEGDREIRPGDLFEVRGVAVADRESDVSEISIVVRHAERRPDGGWDVWGSAKGRDPGSGPRRAAAQLAPARHAAALAEIRRLAEEALGGRAPSFAEYQKLRGPGAPGAGWVHAHMGSWREAVALAGYSAPPPGGRSAQAAPAEKADPARDRSRQMVTGGAPSHGRITPNLPTRDRYLK